MTSPLNYDERDREARAGGSSMAADKPKSKKKADEPAVSYTHLTLPTNREV